jgi:cell division protein FtsB
VTTFAGQSPDPVSEEKPYYRKARPRSGFRSWLRKLLKNKRVLLALIVAAPLVGYLLFGNHGIVQRFSLQREKKELEVKIRTAEDETKSLQAKSRALDGDKRAIEKVAREKHNMARDGEHVYKVSPESD